MPLKPNIEPIWICHTCGNRAFSGRVFVNRRNALTGSERWTVAHWQCDRAWNSDCYYLDIREDLATKATVLESMEHVRMKNWATRTNLVSVFTAALNT